MYRAKDQIFYANLKLIHKANRLSYQDLAFIMRIPYQSLMTMIRRKTRIYERYGDHFARVLGIEKERLFERFLKSDEKGIRMYLSLDHYNRIIEEYYETKKPGRSDYQVNSLHMICRIIANSSIRLYLDYQGMIRIDEESIERNYPLEVNSSSSLIVVDNSISVRDYSARQRILSSRQEAYEKEVELIRYLANRINAHFPCFKGNVRYKKIMLYSLIYKKNHSQMKESFDYEKGYQQFLKDKKVAEELAEKAFGLWDEERIERFYDRLIVYDSKGSSIEDLKQKIRIYRKGRDHEKKGVC